MLSGAHGKRDPPEQAVPGSKRVYANAPSKLAKVDEIVFGKDVDNSLNREGLHDGVLADMLAGAAGGKGNKHEKSGVESKRIYTNAPPKLAKVDEIVFGIDSDNSKVREG